MNRCPGAETNPGQSRRCFGFTLRLVYPAIAAGSCQGHWSETTMLFSAALYALFARRPLLTSGGSRDWPRRCSSNSLARSLDLGFSRIQFTPDLMPSDITGTENTRRGCFDRPAAGSSSCEVPCLSPRVLLADEINIALLPRQQAALFGSDARKDGNRPRAKSTGWMSRFMVLGDSKIQSNKKERIPCLRLSWIDSFLN